VIADVGPLFDDGACCVIVDVVSWLEDDDACCVIVDVGSSLEDDGDRVIVDDGMVVV